MTKLVRSLTATNGKQYGIERAEQYDFEDDGSHFKGYIYKDIPLTQCVSKKYGTFLSIRVDYMRNNFTWKDWSETEECRLTDEFNGCSEVDLDKLVDNLEKIIAKIAILNKEAFNINPFALDTKIAEARKEIERAEKRLDTIKNNAPKNWWELRDYDLKRAKDYIKSEENYINRAKDRVDNIKGENIRRQRDFIQSRGLDLEGFYLNELEEMFGIEA